MAHRLVGVGDQNARVAPSHCGAVPTAACPPAVVTGAPVAMVTYGLAVAGAAADVGMLPRHRG